MLAQTDAWGRTPRSTGSAPSLDGSSASSSSFLYKRHPPRRVRASSPMSIHHCIPECRLGVRDGVGVLQVLLHRLRSARRSRISALLRLTLCHLPHFSGVMAAFFPGVQHLDVDPGGSQRDRPVHRRDPASGHSGDRAVRFAQDGPEAGPPSHR